MTRDPDELFIQRSSLKDMLTSIVKEIKHEQSPKTETDIALINKSLEYIILGIDDIKKSNKEEHKEMICHQKITNGRVNKLEKWRSRIIGGMVVITVVMPIIIGFIKSFVDKIVP